MTVDDAYRYSTLRGALLALEVEAAELLSRAGIYDVLSHGWLDHDTPHPVNARHARWQTSPPFEPDWTILLQGRVLKYVPTGIEEELTRAGEDFVGTLTCARRFMGKALCYFAARSQASMQDNDGFWQEHATTLQWLSIASERLRDFFVATIFRTTKRKYEKGRRDRRKFTAPYQEAVNGQDVLNRQLLVDLLTAAAEIEVFRRKRNRIVHEIATRTAVRSLDVLREQRELATKGDPITIPEISFEELRAGTLSIPTRTKWSPQLDVASSGMST